MRSILHLAVGAALAASLAAVAPLAAFAAPTTNAGTPSAPAPPPAPATADDGTPVAYTGAPALELTLAMVLAGGAQHFRSTSLLSTLAGNHAEAEASKLQTQFGQERMMNFFRVSDFMIVDTMRIFDTREIPRPDAPKPDPSDARALTIAIYRAGSPATAGTAFNVDYLLDHLMTHAVHQQVVQDVGEHFGSGAYPNYVEVLRQTMSDLKAAYAF
jgi:hypothetical protein